MSLVGTKKVSEAAHLILNIKVGGGCYSLDKFYVEISSKSTMVLNYHYIR